MQYDVHLEEVAETRHLAVVRHRARRDELSKVVPKACGVVWEALRAEQIKGAGRHIAIYLDDQINLEVGVEMAAPFPGHGEVVASFIPTGLAAGTVHLGPYESLHEAHRAIHDWCTRNGHTLAGPNWEIYGHWTDDWNCDPSKIRTDVFYLLRA
jgi:effector-binding domain-containing protein